MLDLVMPEGATESEAVGFEPEHLQSIVAMWPTRDFDLCLEVLVADHVFVALLHLCIDEH